MATKHLLVVSTAVALTAMFAGTATSQNTTTVQTKAPQVAFLTPLPPRFVIPPGDPRQPRFCRELQGPLQCPPLLVYGGAAGGGLPTIDPPLKAYLPNVLVNIVIQKISQVVVSNGGVTLEPSFLLPLEWKTTSPDAWTQKGQYAFPLPAPGAPFEFSVVIYDGLVFDACDSFSSFRVDHKATIANDGTPIGEFHGVDDSTIDALGFYNLNYTIRAEDAEGGVSDFHFSGKVSVTCSAADSVY